MVAPIDCGLTLSARARSAVVAGPSTSSRRITADSVMDSSCEAAADRKRRISEPMAWMKSRVAASCGFLGMRGSVTQRQVNLQGKLLSVTSKIGSRTQLRSLMVLVGDRWLCKNGGYAARRSDVECASVSEFIG